MAYSLNQNTCLGPDSHNPSFKKKKKKHNYNKKKQDALIIGNGWDKLT